jgi:hypothetical protein
LFLAFLISAALVTPAAFATGGAATAATSPTLTGIRAAHHPGYDRVVFDFTGGLPGMNRLDYVSKASGADGVPHAIGGRAILHVYMSAGGTPTAPAKVAFALPNVMSVVNVGVYEGATDCFIGLARKETFKVFTLRNPSRLVIDIRAAFPTVQKKVWLFNQKRFLANREPFFTPVLRPVQPLTPATGVMDRIFAGPLSTEYAGGLRALLSEATGFTNLRISNGVARVQLTGGCNARGSTVTIAGSIMPSLKQFSTVRYVKIYDPRGHTGSPNGRSDSIPDCLNP